jgi:hypothetical protein
MTMAREWKGKWMRIYNGPSGILKLAAGNPHTTHFRMIAKYKPRQGFIKHVLKLRKWIGVFMPETYGRTS